MQTGLILQLLFQIGLPLGLLFGTMLTGRWLAGRHYESIRERERHYLSKPAVTFRALDPTREVATMRLALGSIVVSVNYFERFLGAFRLFFGGELKSYASAIDRGRREAILRMKESCPDADVYLNTRMETSTIGNKQGKANGCVELIAFATAVTFKPGSERTPLAFEDAARAGDPPGPIGTGTRILPS